MNEKNYGFSYRYYDFGMIIREYIFQLIARSQ